MTQKKIEFTGLFLMMWAMMWGVMLAGDLAVAGGKKSRLSERVLQQQQGTAEASGRPYANSDWHSQALLPYSNCYISTDPNDLQIDTTSWGLIYEETTLKDKEYLGLHCTSGKSKEYPFTIPLVASNLHHMGALWNIPASQEFDAQVKGSMRLQLENLKNKSAADIFGLYVGDAVGCGCCLGAEKAILIHNGIILSESEFNAGAYSFELAGVELTLTSRDQSHGGMVIYASGPRVGASQKHTSVTVHQVESFKFVHVKPNATSAEIDQKLQQVLSQ